MPIKAQEVARLIIMYADWERIREPDQPGGTYYWRACLDGVTSKDGRADLLKALKEYVPSAKIFMRVTDWGTNTRKEEWTVMGKTFEIKPIRDKWLESRDRHGRFVDRIKKNHLPTWPYNVDRNR